MKKAASMMDAASGRNLTIFTDAPCLVVYAGGYIGTRWTLLDSAESSASCAIVLEAQDVPDTCHFMPENYQIT